MVWMKAFPNHHHAFFLFILTNHLVAQSDDSTEQEKKLSQLLAYKALHNAAAESSFDKVGLLDILNKLTTTDSFWTRINLDRRRVLCSQNSGEPKQARRGCPTAGQTQTGTTVWRFTMVVGYGTATYRMSEICLVLDGTLAVVLSNAARMR